MRNLRSSSEDLRRHTSTFSQKSYGPACYPERVDEKIYGSFPKRKQNKKKYSFSSLKAPKAVLIAIGMMGLVIGLRAILPGSPESAESVSMLEVNPTIPLDPKLTPLTETSPIPGDLVVPTVILGVPSCQGLKFTDSKHAGQDVCKKQQCLGVVYMRYVDPSSYACANDPSLLTHPCDLAKCPKAPKPPAQIPAAPAAPSKAAPAGSGPPPTAPSAPIPYFPGLTMPFAPPIMHNKNTKPLEPTKRAKSSRKTKEASIKISSLSEADPINDVGYAEGKRDKGTFESAKKLWGSDGGPPTSGWPTHAFWQNIVLGEGVDEQSSITVLPYIIQAKENGLGIAYPYVMSTSAQASNMFDLENNGLHLTLSGKSKRSITGYDLLSVSLKFEEKDGSYATATLTQGDPYVSMEVNSAEPEAFRILSSQSMVLASRGEGKVGDNATICDPMAKVSSRLKYVEGSIFEVYTAATDETWRLYTFPSTRLSCPYPKNAKHPPTEINFLDSFKGVVRMALMSNCTNFRGKHCFEASGLPLKPAQAADVNYGKTLDAYKDVMLKGGDVSYDHDEKSNTAFLTLSYKSKALTSEGKDVLPLVLAMPHHVRAGALAFDGAELVPGRHRSMVGSQLPIPADKLELSFNLPKILWGDDRPLGKNQVNIVKKSLEVDENYDLSPQWQAGVGDPYNAGKLNARIARLVEVAVQLNQSKTAETFLDKLEKYQGIWLSGKSPNPLIYDADMGGIVSCGCNYDNCNGKCKAKCTNAGPKEPNGCPNLLAGATAAGMDFGNGYYNDHHFHYGYHLYASAVLARFRPKWAKKYLQNILLLVRDVANPSKEDKMFPRFRHMDFYAGHSWAGGIFRSFINGRNQESTSEAVNCWYAIALLGDALKNKDLKSLGLTLLAAEVHGAQTYWQLIKGNSGYDTIFESNGVTGILWSNLAQFQTWFGQFTWAINGIQMLPFTPASEYLLQPQWVKQQIKPFDKACQQSPMCTGDGWSPLVCMAKSIVDREEGLKCAQKLKPAVFSDLTAEGNGNSQTNTMYFIASRP